MSRRITKLYMQSVASGAPALYRIPVPGRIFASDLGDTFVNGILAGAGTFLVSSGISYLASGRVNVAACASWSAITAGLVVGIPVAGDVLAEIMGDVSEAISEGWTRGRTEPEPSQAPELPASPTAIPDTALSQSEGEWWYKTEQGRLCKYNTPVVMTGRNRGKPIISYINMRAIFSNVIAGTPFSNREMRKKMNDKLSDPQFRALQKDFRRRGLFIVQGDRSGQFTMTGKQVVRAIANYPPFPPKKAIQ